MFDLRELAEWAGAWVPRPVTVTEVTCPTCGKAGVRLVAEGEPFEGEAVCCATCRPGGTTDRGRESVSARARERRL